MAQHRKRHPDKPVIPAAKTLPPFPIWITELLVVLILAGVPFGLGKFFEFSQPDPFDGGAYAYSAWHIFQGAKLWQDEIISAQPATLLVNYLGVAVTGFNETGAELIQMLLQLAAFIVMFFTLRKCFGRVAAVISTSVASIYLSAPLIAKFGNVKEQYMIAFMILAASFMMLAMKTSKKRFWIICGACAVWPYYFKPSGLSILLAVLAFLLILALFRKQTWRQCAVRLLLVAAGAAAGIAPLGVFLYTLTGETGITDSISTLIIQSAVFAAFIILASPALLWLWQRSKIPTILQSIPRLYWIIITVSFSSAYLIGMAIVFFTKNAISGDVSSYLGSTLFFAVPGMIFYKISALYTHMMVSIGLEDIYISGSRKLMGLNAQAPIVLRYYAVLILPIALALASILTGLIRLILRWTKNIPLLQYQDWLVWPLAIWWLLDMFIIWISPRSYEQYYLPMCASASLLAGYVIWRFMENWNPAKTIIGKAVSPAAGLVLIFMVFPILAGITNSPFSGQAYGQRSRGYAQSWQDTIAVLKGQAVQPWQQIGDYIRTHSEPADKIYVWGWYPGIYVASQRLSTVPQAFEGNMHILRYYDLQRLAQKLVGFFEKNPPKFIVDTRKREFPWNVPPLELWPQTAVPQPLFDSQWKGFLNPNPNAVAQYEIGYPTEVLEKQLNNPEEALRFKAMKPLRDYVMQNYRIVQPYSMHVLFERKSPADSK